MNVGVSVNVIENLSHHDDFEFAFNYNRWLLYSMASWPDVQSSILKVCFKILNVAQILVMLGTVVPYVYTVFYANLDIQELMKYLGLLNLDIGIFMKYFVIISYNKTISACIRQMHLDWRYMFEHSRGIMIEHAKVSRYFFFAVVFMWLLAWLSWHIAVWLKEPTVVDNVTLHEIPYETEFLGIEVRAAPYCYYFDVIQFLGDGVMVFIMSNVCLVISFAMHICGQNAILESIVFNIANDEISDRQLNVYLARILKKHVASLRMTSNLEYTFTWIFFIEWFNCIIGVCLILYIMIKQPQDFNDFSKNVISILSLIISFLIICYIGEALNKNSRNLGQSAYLSDWHKLSSQQNLYVLMINKTDKFRNQITIGKMGILSMELFSNVLQKLLAFGSCIKTVSSINTV